MSEHLGFPPPVGPSVTATPAARPSRTAMEGRLVRIEPLDPKRHGDGLWDACGRGRREEMWTYMAVGPFPARENFDAYLAQAARSEDPLFFAIVPRHDGRAAGVASFMRIELAHRVVEVGNIWYGGGLEGSTEATEAMYLMARRAFDELGNRRYEWKTNAFNTRSRRAAERLGFTFEGVFRNHMIVKGRSRDTAWFSMIEEEWPLARRAFERYLDPANFEGSRHRRSLPDIRSTLLSEAS